MNGRKRNGGSKRAALVVALLIAIVVAGGYGAVSWFNHNFARLTRSILPAAGGAPSKSMEPRELVFRLRQPVWDRDGNETIVDRKWHLRLPRAYLWREQAHDDPRLGTRSVFVNLVIDPETGEASPATLADPQARKQYGVLILLRGRGASSRLVRRAKTCIRQDEIDELVEMKKSSINDCLESNNSTCLIHHHIDGWELRAKVSRNIYDNKYQKYCDYFESFLRKSTLSIDDLWD